MPLTRHDFDESRYQGLLAKSARTPVYPLCRRYRGVYSASARVQVLSPAQRAQLAAQRDRLRRRGWIALCCAPLGFVPVVIAFVFSGRVPSDRDIVISGLLMFFGILGALPICLKIALDAMT